MNVYLDEAATTYVSPEVLEAMMPYFTEKFYNPSALYGKAQKIKHDIDLARKTIGAFINADANEIFFTSCGSESNCWAIQGFINNCHRKGIEPVVITSTIEHKSILVCVDNMPVEVHYVGVDKEGFIDIEKLKGILCSSQGNNKNILVSVQLSNNEIGTNQYIEDIEKVVHHYNALLHVDAVQAFCHIPINVKALHIDMLSASGHKVHTPKGIGLLYKNKNIEIDPIIYGSQMDSLRGGTENVAYIIGFSKAVEICKQNMTANAMHVQEIRDYMIDRLVTEFNCKVNGSLEYRLPNNINVTFPQNITGESLLYLLDMSNIMCSTGSACNSHSAKASHVLKAIGLTDDEAARTIRFTLPDDMTKEDVDYVIEELRKNISLLIM